LAHQFRLPASRKSHPAGRRQPAQAPTTRTTI